MDGIEVEKVEAFENAIKEFLQKDEIDSIYTYGDVIVLKSGKETWRIVDCKGIKPKTRLLKFAKKHGFEVLFNPEEREIVIRKTPVSKRLYGGWVRVEVVEADLEKGYLLKKKC